MKTTSNADRIGTDTDQGKPQGRCGQVSLQPAVAKNVMSRVIPCACSGCCFPQDLILSEG